MKYVLIVGAKSDIAKALARQYAKNNFDLYLAARNPQELEPFAQDIRVRTERKVKLVELDILNYSDHQKFYDELEPKPVGVISAVGYLGDQEKAQSDFNEAKRIADTNFTGVMSLLNIIAKDFDFKRYGFIVGISSVAGDRGRKSNYIYGSAKAAFTAYLSGLRNRLHERDVHVMTVKPGFVATKMTEGMDLPEKLTSQPEMVAEEIFTAQQRKKSLLYTKWIWRYIMLIIKHIPEFIFKKTSI